LIKSDKTDHLAMHKGSALKKIVKSKRIPIKGAKSSTAPVSCITFSIKPAPPFRLDLTAWTPCRQPDNIVDRWDRQAYRRAFVVSYFHLLLKRLADAGYLP
jgi:hypothetical protein